MRTKPEYAVFNVNGSREMIYEGTRALDKLRDLLPALGEDAEVAEIRIYENLPIAAEISVGDGYFTTFVWTKDVWIAA